MQYPYRLTKRIKKTVVSCTCKNFYIIIL
jgi:hypothetical protein